MKTNGKTICEGVVRGRTIELREAIDLPEGQEVRITVEPAVSEDERVRIAREHLLRAAGAWKDDAEELDAFLEWNRQQRRIGDRPPIEE